MRLGHDDEKSLRSVAASSFRAAILLIIIFGPRQVIFSRSRRRRTRFQTCHDLHRGAQLQLQLWPSGSYVTVGADRALIATRAGTAASVKLKNIAAKGCLAY